MQRSLNNHLACVSLIHEKASDLPRRGVTTGALLLLRAAAAH
jgi:hypothetical protein